MKIYHRLEEFHKVPQVIATIGTFDGMHLGHQKILQRLIDLAKTSHGESLILTFFPHPRLVLNPDDHALKMINTMDEKIKLLGDFGIDHLLVIPFTKEFSRLSSEEFILQILVEKIGVKKLVIGYDHHFGKNREGSFEHLKKFAPRYGFEVEEIPKQDIDETAVSSTRIRKALEAGDVQTATQYLGRAFTLKGQVVEGDKIGRSLGYPTANICVEESYKLIPADGIYAVEVLHDNKKYKGMLYIGHRPTIGGMSRNIEVNIFDFDKTIYNDFIEVSFLKFIRPDMKFNNLDELKIQMGKDKEQAL